MATERWAPGGGQGLTWGPLFAGSAGEVNGLPFLNSVISAAPPIVNGTFLDMFMDISILLASAAFVGVQVGAVPYLAFYLYPLNQDNTTYGDNRFTTQTAAQPSGQYYSTTIPLVAATQAQYGTGRGIVMPPGTFKMVVFNGGGVTLAGGGNTIAYRTYNRSIV